MNISKFLRIAFLQKTSVVCFWNDFSRCCSDVSIHNLEYLFRISIPISALPRLDYYGVPRTGGGPSKPTKFLRARSLVARDLRSETKGSRFGSSPDASYVQR